MVGNVAAVLFKPDLFPLHRSPSVRVLAQLQITRKGLDAAGQYPVEDPVNLVSLVPMDTPIGLYNPSTDAALAVVKTPRNDFRGRSFDLQTAESPAAIDLYRYAPGQELDLKHPDMRVIMTWRWADRFHTTKCIIFDPAIVFINETDVALEVG